MGLLFGQKKLFEDVTLGSGKLRLAFFMFYDISWNKQLIVKIIGRLIDNEIIVSCSPSSQCTLK